jgi:hypothetical protein
MAGAPNNSNSTCKFSLGCQERRESRGLVASCEQATKTSRLRSTLLAGIADILSPAIGFSQWSGRLTRPGSMAQLYAGKRPIWKGMRELYESLCLSLPSCLRRRPTRESGEFFLISLRGLARTAKSFGPVAPTTARCGSRKRCDAAGRRSAPCFSSLRLSSEVFQLGLREQIFVEVFRTSVRCGLESGQRGGPVVAQQGPLADIVLRFAALVGLGRRRECRRCSSTPEKKLDHWEGPVRLLEG